MSDLNLCQFIGHLGRDPEVRYLPNGDAVCNISIGVGWKTKDKEGTEWVRASAFGKLAEICGKYLIKGSQVYIAGNMSTRKWADKDGVEKYTTEIRVNEMQMLGGRPTEDKRPATAPAPAARAPAPATSGFDSMDDDIPF